jgi:hypothetical protein
LARFSSWHCASTAASHIPRRTYASNNSSRAHKPLSHLISLNTLNKNADMITVDRLRQLVFEHLN